MSGTIAPSAGARVAILTVDDDPGVSRRSPATALDGDRVQIGCGRDLVGTWAGVGGSVHFADLSVVSDPGDTRFKARLPLVAPVPDADPGDIDPGTLDLGAIPA